MAFLDELKKVDLEQNKFEEEKKQEVIQDIVEPNPEEQKALAMSSAEDAATQGLSPAAAYIQRFMKPERDINREKRLKQTATINAVGQNLTNVIDAIYGSKGARIPVRQDQTTDKLMGALSSEQDRFRQEEDRYQSALIGQMVQDINLDEKRGHEAGLLKDKIAREDELRGSKIAREDELYGIKKTDSAAVAEQKKKDELELIKARGESYYSRQKDAAKTKKELADEKEANYFPISEVGEGISDPDAALSLGQYNSMRKLLQESNINDDLIDQLRYGESISTQDMDNLIAKYWDKFFDYDSKTKDFIPTRGSTKGGYIRETPALKQEEIVNELY